MKILKSKQRKVIFHLPDIQGLQEEEVRLQMQISVLEMEREDVEKRASKCRFFVEQEIINDR